MQESDEIRLARDFFAMFDTDLRGAYARYFADHVEHANSGMKTMDKAETLAAFFGDDADLGFVRIEVEIVRIAQAGRTVMTERIDRHCDAAGREVLVTPVCGTIDIEDGLIVRMAEYFDSAPVHAYFAARTNVVDAVYEGSVRG
jgi:limonene-1,2-epoxide hydrolase